MSEEYNKEQVLQKMRELKFKRENELMETDIDLEKSQMLDVKYLGTINYKGENKHIYLLLEQHEGENGNKIEIERYYTEDGEFLGGNNKVDQYNFIILDENHQNEQKLLENLNKLDKEGIESLNKIEEERLEEIAKSLGFSKEDIEKLSEINLDEENQNEEEKDNGKREKKIDEKSVEGKEVLSKEKVDKISTKTEIKTNQKVTDKETISQMLGVQDKGYKSIGIVYSDKIKDNKNNTRFSIVGIKEDGSAERIDTLEQEYGINPNKSINAINKDGSNIEQEQVNSIYKVKGKKETQLAVDIGAMGTIEASLVRTPQQDNEEAISIPVETSNIKPTTREVREFMNETKNPRIKEEIEKAKEHQELGCEPSIKDIDDNEYNDTHTHFEIDEEYLNKCATKILENDEIANVYNRTDVIKCLKEKINNDERINLEKLIEQVEEEMEEKVKDEHEPYNRRR